MVWQSSSNPIFDGHHSFDWLSHPEISQKPLKSKTHCGFVKFSTQRLIKSTAIEDKSVCITNTEKQDTLTLFRQDREFDLKKKFYRWGKHTFLLIVPNTLHIFPPRIIVLFRNDEKSSLERCEIVSVGDLGRPSRSSGPPGTAGQRTRRSILT